MPADRTYRESHRKIRLGRSGPKHVRVDRPFGSEPPADAPAEVGNPGLLELLKRAIAGDRGDRRSSVRHATGQVGWWSGDQFGATIGRLLDLSRGGARVILSAKPPRKQSVWLYKEVGTTLSFVRGDLVGIGPAPGGEFCARFRFAAHCPTLLCQALICGDHLTPTPEPVNDFRPER
jgi:hypothetical protein